MRNKLPQHYYLWLMMVIIITALCGLIYASVQQVLREDGNDPQVEVSQNFVQALNAGQNPTDILPSSKIDPSKSLTPFVIIYDNNNQVLASSASMNNQTPTLPSGVLDNVKRGGEERLTWQPDSVTRIAAVIVKYNNGTVLVGRSLKEVEDRESQLTKEVLIIWLGLIFSTTLLTIAYPKLIK